jgi:hypothetical protein
MVEALTKQMISLNIGKMYHIDALLTDLDSTDFIIPDALLKNAKISLNCAILNSSQTCNKIVIY